MIKLSTLTGRPLLRLVSSLKTRSSTMLAGDSSQVTNLRTLFFKVDFVHLLVNLFTKVFHRRLGGLLHQAGSDRHVHNHDHNYNNHNHHNRCPQEGCGQQEGEEAAQGGLSNENIVGSSMEALCPLDSTNPIQQSASPCSPAEEAEEGWEEGCQDGRQEEGRRGGQEEHGHGWRGTGRNENNQCQLEYLLIWPNCRWVRLLRRPLRFEKFTFTGLRLELKAPENSGTDFNARNLPIDQSGIPTPGTWNRFLQNTWNGSPLSDLSTWKPQ